MSGDHLQGEAILKALSQVIDPDLKQDIVTLGFIKNLKFSSSHVEFDLALTTPACPVRDELMQECHERVMALEGIESVQIRLTAQEASPSKVQSPHLQQIRHIIAVSSCKGGVGKSTVAANLSIALSALGAEVGLLDADIHGPSQPTLLGLSREQPLIEDQTYLPLSIHGVKMMSSGYLFPENEAATLRGPMVANVLNQILHATQWGKLDYLVIDMPPGTGDVQISLSQTVPLSGALIVTTPQKLALIDVAKGIAMFDQVQVPIIGIVENMAYFPCLHCGEENELYGESGAQSLAHQYGLKILSRLPFIPQIVEDSDRGLPSALSPSSQGGQKYHQLAESVVRSVAQEHHNRSHILQVDIEW